MTLNLLNPQIDFEKELFINSSFIINRYGYPESILIDDDYLHDFIIDCKSLFTEREFQILLSYNTILQYKVANQK